MAALDAQNAVLEAIEEITGESLSTELHLDTPLFGGKGLAIDSLAALELMSIIEAKLDMEIDDTQVDYRALATVRDVVIMAEKFATQRG